MSLIEEALRRIQDPLLPTQQPGSSKPASKQPGLDAPTPAHSWTPDAPPRPQAPSTAQRTTNALMATTTAVIALTAALVAGGAIWLLQTARMKPDEPLAMRPTTESHTIVVPPIVATPPTIPAPDRVEPAEPSPAPEPPKAAEPPPPAPNTSHAPSGHLPEELSLSGIVEGLGDPYAVINGTIVGIGERIGTFTLIAVHNGAAVLRRDDGTDTILRVSPH